MPKRNGAADPGETYARLIAEREKRRAALVRDASLVGEHDRYVELKERVYACLTESFDWVEVETCPNKRGALVQQGTSLLNTYVKLVSLCNQRIGNNQPARPKKEQAGE